MDKLLSFINNVVTEGKALTNSQLDEIKDMIQEEIEESAEKLAKIKGKLDDGHMEDLVREKVDEKTDEIKVAVEKELNEAHEADLAKFSDFVNQIVEEMLSELDEETLYYAKLGEGYEDIIESIKERIMIQEGTLPEEVKELMTTSKEVIEKLETQQDEIMAENLDLKLELNKKKTELLVTEKTKDIHNSLAKIVKEYFANTEIEEAEKEIDTFIASLVKISKDDELDEEDDIHVDEKIDDIENPPANEDEGMDKYLSTYKEFE